MIHENELRIGNWVIVDGKKTEWSLFDFYEMVEFKGGPDDIIEPIHLTHEIIVQQCGFEIKNDYANGRKLYYHDAGIFLDYYIDSFALCYQGGQPISQPFKSLHQLQNLYFALTGKELPVQF